MPEQSNRSLAEGSIALGRRLAEGGAEPPGGAIAALVAAWAAALAGAAADRSREGWEGAAGARAQAHALRTRALRLLERGAEAHAQAMETLAERGQHVAAAAENESRGAADAENESRGAADAERERRDWRLGQAVKRAAGPPLELSACALNVAQLAELIASHAAGDVRADAAVAAQLAAAAARAGAHLVEINLVVGGDRRPAVQARELAAQAAAAAANASVVE